MKARRVPLARFGGLLAAACLLGAGAVAGAQGLERLFSTPEERARLDILRRSHEHRTPPAPPTQVEGAPFAPSLTVNGLVTRSSGADSVWVNGERVSRGERTQAGIRVRAAAGARVRVTLPRGAGTVRLKAGQNLDLETGVVRDAYQGDTAASATPGPPSRAGAGDSGA